MLLFASAAATALLPFCFTAPTATTTTAAAAATTAATTTTTLRGLPKTVLSMPFDLSLQSLCHSRWNANLGSEGWALFRGILFGILSVTVAGRGPARRPPAGYDAASNWRPAVSSRF